MTALLWFRRDLRLSDNPALAAAQAAGRPVVCAFLLDDEDAGEHRPGAASRWWLHGSLERLAADLNARGNRLILRRGRAEREIARLVAETGATDVFWNRVYEPWQTARDARIKTSLKENGIGVRSFNASLLAEPWELATGKKEPYRVFTPFWRALRARPVRAASPNARGRIVAPDSFPPGEALADWTLRPRRPDWANGLREAWSPGEAAALAALDSFADHALESYPDARDQPALAGTSRLSPHLHFGEIGPRQVWHRVQSRAAALTGDAMPGWAEKFLSEIAWREFSHHLLHHFPEMTQAPLKAEFARLQWDDNPALLKAWQRGRTGYPIVDAGMRELWTTGWMHNRVRMIVASLLVKDLLIDWREGARWFWDTLVDADLANNSASWQWVAGSGADAAPYFRVFNPALQSAKFDSAGLYIRRWLPELAGLPGDALHAPWMAAPAVLEKAGVILGRHYPRPIVEHAAAKARALAAYRDLRKAV